MPVNNGNQGGIIKAAAIGAALLGLGVLVYRSNLHARTVRVNEIHLKLPNLTAEFDGYRIAHITDLHTGRIIKPRHIANLVELVNQCQPDLIALTGDFVTHNSWENSPELGRALAGMSAPDGVYAVLGNHDHWSGARSVRSMLAQAGIEELANRSVSLRRDTASLHIAGVDSAYIGYARLDRVLESLPEDGAAVLLAHEPDTADLTAASGRFDLQLSGHSHGGQVYIPKVTERILPRLGRKYPRGLYEVNGMMLYTNAGIGVIHLPLRWDAQPEVALLVLHAETGSTR